MEANNELHCNSCQVRLKPDTSEFHDALHWEDVAGYGSVFGDGTRVSLTLCGPCLDRVVGHLLKREEL